MIALFGINSIVLGMLIKIVPFLVWFHLQAQAMDALLKGRSFTVPTMKEIISDETIKTQMVFHAAVLLGFLWAFWSDDTSLLSLAGILSFSFLPDDHKRVATILLRLDGYRGRCRATQRFGNGAVTLKVQGQRGVRPIHPRRSQRRAPTSSRSSAKEKRSPRSHQARLVVGFKQ